MVHRQRTVQAIAEHELHPARSGMRSTLHGILANALLAAIKGTAGVLGNSYALIADAIESASDVVSSFIVWTGLKYSSKPPDANHPYGHGKAEPLAAVVVGLALLAAAFGIATQSLQEIRTPHHAPAPFTLCVLLLVILAKEALFRHVLRVGEDVSSVAVKVDAWHHRSDALTSGAAFVGISVALIGGKGWESADDWAALFASAIIAYNAAHILRPALEELTDASPDEGIRERVQAVAQAVDGVRGLDKCYVRKMGFDYHVDLDVVVERDLPIYCGHEIAHRVQAAVRQDNPRILRVLVHIEPTEEK